MESWLTAHAGEANVTLILPCHERELDTPALDKIILELRCATWIKRIIIGLDGCVQDPLPRATQAFSGLPQDLHLLWTQAPPVLALEADLKAAGFTTAVSGKGRNVWLCAGLLLAQRDRIGIAALHDCDITDYSSELLARLVLPLLEKSHGFRFNKGFYSRHRDRLHGRLGRFLVRPLLQAMELRAGPVPVLQFLSAFRYPLAGESAMDLDLLAKLNFPATWGLEIGLLHEVRRQLGPSEVCQTELCAASDHRHQELSPLDPSAGLHRMAREVAGTLLASVTGGTYPWREQIVETWQDMASAALRHAHAEAVINGLLTDPTQDQLAVTTFATALQAAIEAPAPPALLPSWQAVERAVPGVFERLHQAGSAAS